ncbi:MAG: 2-phosphosulfolactate phosphatase [Bacteroidetes bacterium]|nr:2-phosphosulfolactate phosphatase [Bacteroidota bacterium]
MSLTIDACFSPYLYPVYRNDDNIVVIIDILRATSAICIAFENGAEKIIPVATVEEARKYKEQGYLVGAERDAVKLDGFDFGNSPYDYMGENIKGQTLVLTTTNGTQAIEAAKESHKVVIGSFLNIDALCDWLVKQNKNILLLCSGWKNKFNLEDALFAGSVTEEIQKRSAEYAHGDGCLALKYLYQIAEKDPLKFLNYSSHKERLARLGLKNDIRFCLTPNQTSIIPVLQDGALVAIKS